MSGHMSHQNAAQFIPLLFNMRVLKINVTYGPSIMQVAQRLRYGLGDPGFESQ
jgi:hypothetical protein